MLSADVVCVKCGSVIYQMRMLKSVKDTLCVGLAAAARYAATLNPTDFMVSVNKR
jgi:hypothetical protein